MGIYQVLCDKLDSSSSLQTYTVFTLVNTNIFTNPPMCMELQVNVAKGRTFTGFTDLFSFVGVLCVPLDGVSRKSITYREQHKPKSKNTRENPSFPKQVPNRQSQRCNCMRWYVQELDRPSAVIDILK